MRTSAQSIQANTLGTLTAPAERGRFEPGLRNALSRIQGCVAGLCRGWQARAQSRRLRVSDTVSLGEKRFVAILEVDGERLLIGGGADTVTLLRTLSPVDGQLASEKIYQARSEDGSPQGVIRLKAEPQRRRTESGE